MAARVAFEQELEELNNELLVMSKMVQTAIEKSFEALRENDVALAKEVMKNDRAVDDMERRIESHCLSLMLRQQPVAGDLRHISAALKVVTDLERMGDHASDVAELSIHLGKELKNSSIQRACVHLPEMVEQVKIMVEDAICAFANRDVETAKQFEQRDDVIDAFFDKIKEEVAVFLKTEGEYSNLAVDLLMIAKYLERIGDHSVNVCEWTEFSDTGTVREVLLL